MCLLGALQQNDVKPVTATRRGKGDATSWVYGFENCVEKQFPKSPRKISLEKSPLSPFPWIELRFIGLKRERER